MIGQPIARRLKPVCRADPVIWAKEKEQGSLRTPCS